MRPVTLSHLLRGHDQLNEAIKVRNEGVDIKVTNSQYRRTFFIEAKGASSYRAGFEVAFVYSLGQIVTRMTSLKARYYFGIALPKKSADIAVRRIPQAFAVGVCLHVFSVDDNGKVVWYKPVDIKKYQQNHAKR